MTIKITQLISQRTQSIQPSPTLVTAARAEALQAAGKPIINLSVGEPDFDTPEHIKKAAIQAIQAGHTKYTAIDGIASLKQAIASKFKHDNKLHYELNQILVSCGAKHSIYNLLLATINPGDEVIIPAPYWVSYPDMVKLVDGHPVIVNTDFSNHFKMTTDQLRTAITKKTRLCILNSPSNPTGMTYTESELKELGAVFTQHPHILVVSDDIYEHTIWNTSFVNIINACPELYDNCVVVNGVSKTYAMTGWRIGYAAGPVHIISAMKKAQSQSTSNPASISQYAAQAALTGDQSCVTNMVNAYQERHDYLIKELQQIPGVQCLRSNGTFYTFPSIKKFLGIIPNINTDIEFAEFLLNQAEIAVVPGSAFGTPGHIRLSYATQLNLLHEAMKRLRKVLTYIK